MTTTSPIYLLLFVILAVFATTQGSISLKAHVGSTDVILVNSSVVQPPFDSLSGARSNIFLLVQDDPVTFSLASDQAYSYSLTILPLSK